MRFTFVVIFCLVFTNFSNYLYAQITENMNVFTKEWIYPDLPDSLIKPTIIETTTSTGCPVYPSENLRTFANIRGMACDGKDNLYVWDSYYTALWKFSSEGKMLWRKKFDTDKYKGFTNVGPGFAVSHNGKICLGDKREKLISILDDKGCLINNFKVDMLPASITFGKDESIYIIGFPMSYKGNLIQHYDIDGNLINSFCERKDMTIEVIMSGNAGHLSCDEEGNIYYAHFFPYRINKYSPDGKLLKTINNNKDDFKSPHMKEGRVEWNSGLRGVMCLPNKYMAVITYLERESGNWRIDFYNTDKDKAKLFSNESLAFNFTYRNSAIDSKGNIYFDVYSATDPVIIKYKVDYNNL